MLGFLDKFNINFLNIYLVFPFIFALIVGLFNSFYNPIQVRLFSKIFFVVNFILSALIYLTFGYDSTKFFNISFTLDNVTSLYIVLNSLIFLIFNLFSKTSINRFHKLFYPVVILFSGLINIIILTDNILALFVVIFWYILIDFLLKSTYLKEKEYFSILKKQFALDLTIFFIGISLFILNLAQYFINIEIEPCYSIIQALISNMQPHNTLFSYFGVVLISIRFLNLFPFLSLNINNTNKINNFVSTFLLISSTFVGSFLILKFVKTFSFVALDYKNAIIIYLIVNIFYYAFASFKNENIVKKLTYLFASSLAIVLTIGQIEQRKEEIFILFVSCLILSYLFCFMFCFIFENKFKSLKIQALKRIEIKNKILKLLFLLSFLNLACLPLFGLFSYLLITLIAIFQNNNLIFYPIIFGVFLTNISIYNLIYQLFIEKSDRLISNLKLSYYQFLSLFIVAVGLVIFSILPIAGDLF